MMVPFDIIFSASQDNYIVHNLLFINVVATRGKYRRIVMFDNVPL